MKNLHEIRTIPFTALLSTEDRQKITDEEVPEALQPLATALGVKKATDSVDFTLSVGSVVFDVYDAVSEKPKAPLALERENIKRQKLAKSLDKEEIDLDEDVKGKLEKALGDDNVWQGLRISVTYKVGEETRYSQLSSAALDVFTDCRKALLDSLI